MNGKVIWGVIGGVYFGIALVLFKIFIGLTDVSLLFRIAHFFLTGSFAFVGFILFQYALSKEKSSLVYPINHTVVTSSSVIAGVLLLGETLTRMQIVAIILIVLSLFLITHKK